MQRMGVSGKRVSHISHNPGQSLPAGPTSIAAIEQPIRSRLQDPARVQGVETTSSEGEVRKVGTASNSKRANRISPTTQDQGQREQSLIDKMGQVSSCLAEPNQFGAGEVNSRAGEQKEMHSIEFGKRAGNIRPNPDPSALFPTQATGNNQQAAHTPSQNSFQEAVARTIAKKWEGSKRQRNITSN